MHLLFSLKVRHHLCPMNCYQDYSVEYLGEMMDLCFSHRAEDLDHRHMDTSSASARVILTCTMPLSEIVTDFFDKLKGRSSGFASFE
jgi:translation factor GUF1, mitochondrial